MHCSNCVFFDHPSSVTSSASDPDEANDRARPGARASEVNAAMIDFLRQL
jgi:hypothetical protein